jgi:hypothetical protein
MKPWLALTAVAVAVLFIGCADPLEQRSGNEVQSQLQKGVTGQGQLSPEQREPGDPAGEHGVPQTHP